jgi:uncharacterized protein (TIGR03435 family)
VCVVLKSRLLGAVGIVVVVGGVLMAQTPAGPVFEVVSVKPNVSSGATTILIQAGGRFVATHVTLRTLLSNAFRQDRIGLREDQMIGTPPWLTTAFFDIEARASSERELPVNSSVASTELPAFLRSLLADRFKLTAHMETQQRPIYALVKLTKGPELGPALHRSPIVDCASADAHCGRRPPVINHVNEVGVTMAQVAADLSAINSTGGRPVIDRTGLPGRYDMTLQWLPPPGTDNPRAPGAATPDEEVSVFTAIQEQLGLKLESSTGPVDVLVIDHVEHPTDN